MRFALACLSLLIGVVLAPAASGIEYGVQVVSDGTQHARAYVEGERVRLLVAKFCMAGAEHFFASHLKAERQPLHQGSVIEDNVIFATLGPQTGGDHPRP